MTPDDYERRIKALEAKIETLEISVESRAAQVTEFSWKAWVEKYCESLHLDLKKYQIVVTSICPGFIRTPFTANNKHKMPFLMETDQAGREIIKAIEKEKVRHVFPKTLGSVALLLSYLPRRIYSKVIKVYSPDSDYKKA